MTYYAEVIKDVPYSLWLFGGTISDASGYAATPVNTGTLATYAAPLVNGESKSSLFTPGIFTGIPFPYDRPGTERQPFTLEAWVFPQDTTLSILAHKVDLDGLAILNGAVTFSIRLSSGMISVSYTPPFARKMHVVGVYTGVGLQLFIDGVLVRSYDLTYTEIGLNISLTTDDGYLYVGNNNGIVQGLATYQYALDQNKIASHYEEGNRTCTTDVSSKLFGGNHIEFSTKTANIFFTKEWTNLWEDGYYTAVIGEKVSSAIDPVTNLYIASSWESSFELNSGGTSINGVQISWESSGTILVETSLDGVTWSTATNTKKVTGISAGYDPTGVVLRVRVSFSAGIYGEITELKLVGIKAPTISSLLVPVTIPSGTIISPSREMQLQSYDTGIQFTGTLALGPDTTVGATGFNSMSYWYYCETGATISNDFAGTIFYQNAAAVATAVVNKRWTFVTVTRPTLNNSVVNFTGTNAKIANVSFYETVLTPAQIQTIFTSYLGINRITGSESAIATSIVDGTAIIYKADWSVSPGG